MRSAALLLFEFLDTGGELGIVRLQIGDQSQQRYRLRGILGQFPLLGGVNIVRSWGALRVMTPDGCPIYEASAECPGAFLVTCHSGVTLAALSSRR